LKPAVIGGLFLDNWDFRGLYYWYEDIVAVNEEIKAQIKKK
jgi:hypothetical protein